jgi:hypothetical protein
MPSAVRVSGIGIALSGADDPQEAQARADRLRAALPPSASPVRFVHPIEEVAFLAAGEALIGAGRTVPVSHADIGIALGVEEGIDGIKARYFEGILRDGPLGASPMAFPLTTPNTIAARIQILLDLRGESFTLCGGSLSGGHAVGLAIQAVRAGHSQAMLAGGTTAVEQEFLDALRQACPSKTGELGCGACLFFLESGTAGGSVAPAGYLLGYAEGFGAEGLRDAIRDSLADAAVVPEGVACVWVAEGVDRTGLADGIRRAGVQAPVLRSNSHGRFSASFPLAVAEALRSAAVAPRLPALVVGTDCLVGAAAAVIRGGA